MSPLRAVPVLLVVLALAPSAWAAGPHTYVSGVGDDANSCGFNDPCKTWAGAESQTDPGGVITAIDPGGYGVVTITKSLTLEGSGTYASTLASGASSAITVNVPNGDVVLRDLDMEPGPACGAAGSTSGVRLVNAHSLRIVGGYIRGFANAGVDIEPTADGATTTIDGTSITDNCTAGVLARRSAGSTSVLISDSLISRNPTGVLAGNGATVTITDNSIFGNVTGLAFESGGALPSWGDNRVAGNTTDGAPSAELAPQPAGPQTQTVTVTNTTTNTVTVPAPAPPAATRCTVPRIVGRTPADAAARLSAAHCGLGRVFYNSHGHMRRGRVMFQNPARGWVGLDGARVNVVVKGRAPRTRKRAHAARSGATRSWVAAGGDDLNPCSRTAPCATFAAAQAATQTGGQISVVNSGDYGTLTIDDAITIDGGPAHAEIQAAGTTGIVVAAGSASNVTLRNLTLDAVTPCSAAGAADGIRLNTARTLHLDNVTIRGFSGTGLDLAAAADATVDVRGGQITGNCTAGVAAQPSAGVVGATVDGTTIGHDNLGISAGNGATIRLGRTLVEDNATAVATSGSGAVFAWPGAVFASNTALGATPGTIPTV